MPKRSSLTRLALAMVPVVSVAAFTASPADARSLRHHWHGGHYAHGGYYHGHYRGGGSAVAAGIAGLAIGTMIGAASSPTYYDPYYSRVYVAPPPVYAYPRTYYEVAPDYGYRRDPSEPIRANPYH